MFFKKNYGTEKIQEVDLKKYSIIDVRTRDEFKDGHIPGAINIELQNLTTEASKKLQKDKTYYIVCASGMRSGTACNILAKQGYSVVNLKGGMMSYGRNMK